MGRKITYSSIIEIKKSYCNCWWFCRKRVWYRCC